MSDHADRPNDAKPERVPPRGERPAGEWIRELDEAQPAPPERVLTDLNLSAQTLYDFITSDFESAWAALSAMRPSPGRSGRGNMMFARQAMNLLEFACRLYDRDEEARADFSTALFQIEPRYFTLLPAPCITDGSILLPYHPEKGPTTADSTLVGALFDLVRHGLAHLYQTLVVRLTDYRVLAVGVTGVVYGEALGDNLRRDTYMGYRKATYNDLVLNLYPDVLYLDVKRAMGESRLLDRGLSLDYAKFGRGRESGRYQFDVGALEAALVAAGHQRLVG